MRATDYMTRVRREYDGWLIVGVAFCAAALAIGSSNYAFEKFIVPLEREFEWGRTAISASLSFMAVGSLTSPLIGRAMDRYGARPVMSLCLVLFGLSMVLRPFMTELWHFYVLSFIQFAGFSGATGLPAGRLVGIWFPHIRGRVMGITLMGNNFGGLTMPIITQYAIVSVSWGAAYALIGSMAFLVAIITLLVVREHPRNWDIRSRQTDGASPTHQANLTGLSFKEAARTKGLYAMMLAMTLATFTYSTVLPHVGAHLTAQEIPQTVVLTAVGLLATLGMLGKLFFGYLAERITARKAMMLSLSGQSAFILLMVGYPSLPLIWLTVPLFGFCMGGYGVLSTLLVQESFGLRYFGTISGMVGIPSVISLFAGPLLAGASFDITGGYGYAYAFIAVLFVISVVTLTQVHDPAFLQQRAAPRS